MKLGSLVRSASFKRYVCVGVATVGVDYGLLLLLTKAGVNVYVAATISFWASLVVNFCLSKLWTFKVANTTGHHLTFYALVILLNYLVGLVMIALAKHLGFSYFAGKFVATILTTVWNYFLYKHVVFLDKNRAWFNIFERLRRKQVIEGAEV